MRKAIWLGMIVAAVVAGPAVAQSVLDESYRPPFAVGDTVVDAKFSGGCPTATAIIDVIKAVNVSEMHAIVAREHCVQIKPGTLLTVVDMLPAGNIMRVAWPQSQGNGKLYVSEPGYQRASTP